MHTSRIRLFRMFGIPINLDVSWLIIVALLTWTLSELFQEQVPGLSGGAYVALGLIGALTFFACILLHEMGHALVARATGIPMRGITLFMFGGVAELEDEPRSAASEFVMAIAGPLVSGVLASIFGMLAWFGSGAAWPREVLVMLYALWWINITVLLFNLVPAFPLDGGRVLRSVLWGATGNVRRATWWASIAGRAFAWILIASALMHLFEQQWLHGLWLGLIGMFLHQAALAGYHQVLIRQYLSGEPVSRFMTPHPITVPSDLDLRRWVDDYVYYYHRKMFPVATNGPVEGVITTQMLSDFPAAEWPNHTVGEMMLRDVDSLSVSPQTDALNALGRMQRLGTSRLLVRDGDRLVGILSLKDLLDFLQLKMDLEDEPAGPSAAEVAPPAQGDEAHAADRRHYAGSSRD